MQVLSGSLMRLWGTQSLSVMRSRSLVSGAHSLEGACEPAMPTYPVATLTSVY